ncbi:MAG: hypothetical protein AMXMBFR33_65700 [Candidatus Xenobia bacterium]
MKLPVPGEVVASRYEVEALIKTGGQSIVFRGREVRTGARVALKLMQDYPGNEREQFEREYHVLKEPGPGLPLAHLLTEYEGTSLIVVDWVEGESLDDLPLPIDCSLAERIAREVLATVQHLHERNPPVVVRDIKPANLILSTRGVFLIDLSASRFVTGNPDTMPLGSPGFAAPEQYVGRSELRSDLYATGTLLFHLLTGRDPLTETPPFSARRYRSQVPQGMERMIRRATEPDPSDRPADSAEMLADLTGTAALPPAPRAAPSPRANPPVGAASPSPRAAPPVGPAGPSVKAAPPVGAPGASPSPARRFSLAWAVVLLAVGVGLFGLWKDQRRLARELNLPAPPPRAASKSPAASFVQPLPESASAQAYFDRGTHLLADSNPLGFYYLAAACRLDPGREPYRRELEERLARFPRLRLAIPLEHRLKEPEADAAARGDGQLKTPPALSIDGRWLACDFNGTLLDLQTGDRRKLNSYVSSLAYLPSGRALVLGSGLRLLELESGQAPGPPFELPPGHRVRLVCPVGQDRLLILSAAPGTHHRTLQLYGLSDGRPVGEPIEDIAFYRASADHKRVLLYRCPEPREGKTTSFPQGSIEHWDLTDWKKVSSLPLDDEYILVGLDAGSLRAVLVKSWIRISILDLTDGSEFYPTTSSQKFSKANLVVSRMTNDGHWFAWEFGEPPQAAQWWHVPSARALPAGRKVLATDFGGQHALYREGQGQLGIWQAGTGRDHGLALGWSGEHAQFGADGLLLLPSKDRVQLVDGLAGTLADWSARGMHWSHLAPAAKELLVATEQKSLLVWDLKPDQPLEPSQEPFWLVGSHLGLWPTDSQLTGLRYLEASELSKLPELQRWTGPAEQP